MAMGMIGLRRLVLVAVVLLIFPRTDKNYTIETGRAERRFPNRRRNARHNRAGRRRARDAAAFSDAAAEIGRNDNVRPVRGG